MKKFIFATDIDGTLLMDNREIHPITLEAFKEAQAKGHPTVIATGRNVKNTKILLEKIPYIDYFVCNNGALVYDVKNDKAISVHSLKPIDYIKMFNFYIEHKNECNFKMHTDKDIIGFPESEHDLTNTLLTDELNNEIQEYIKNNPNDQSLFNGQKITQLSLFASDTFCSNYYKQLKKSFTDATVFLTNSVYLDVNPQNVSKWTGLVELANYLNISNDSIVTFGDSGNDFEMLYHAKENGYPLANSKPDLVEKIKPKLDSNNTGTIGETIKKYINQN